MALTSQQIQFVQNLIGVSNQIAGNGQDLSGNTSGMGISNAINFLVGEWNLHLWATSGMADADVTAAFPHLNLAKVTAGMTAIEAVQTALGNNVSGQLTNLIIMLPF